MLDLRLRSSAPIHAAPLAPGQTLLISQMCSFLQVRGSSLVEKHEGELLAAEAKNVHKTQDTRRTGLSSGFRGVQHQSGTWMASKQPAPAQCKQQQGGMQMLWLQMRLSENSQGQQSMPSLPQGMHRPFQHLPPTSHTCAWARVGHV